MLPVPEKLREANLTAKLTQKLGLFDDLRPAHIELFKLDSNLLTRLNIQANVDFTEGPGSDLFAHLESIGNPDFVLRVFS